MLLTSMVPLTAKLCLISFVLILYSRKIAEAKKNPFQLAGFHYQQN